MSEIKKQYTVVFDSSEDSTILEYVVADHFLAAFEWANKQAFTYDKGRILRISETKEEITVV